MSDPIALLTEVWNVASIVFSAGAGLALGYFAVGQVASDPAYASGESTPREYGALVALLAGAIGLVFFSFQVLATYVDGDPGWTRVVSRLFIWFLYSVAIGVGTTARLRWHVSRKKAEAHAQAMRELDK